MLRLKLPYSPSDPTDPSIRAAREIETFYNEFLLHLPTPELLRLVDTDPGNPTTDAEALTFGVILNIYQRLLFLFSSNVLKTRNLVEGLSWSLSSANYLVWTLAARSLLEHSAVLSKYVTTLDKLGLTLEERTLTELGAIHDCLYRYTNGTRFNWEALIRGDYEDLDRKFSPPEDESALNVLTAVDHSAKLRPALRANRTWYEMLSDFAHPNKASHSFYLGLAATNIGPGVVLTEMDVAATTPPARAEFVLRWTLPAVYVNVGNIEEHLRRLIPAVRLWSERTEGRVQVESGTVRFVASDDRS